MANNTPRSDAELRKLTLRIGDPHQQQGLVMDIPVGATFVDVVNTYEHPGWPEEKAYCAVCRAYRHRDGYTCLMSNGSLILAGSKCGKDLSGETFIHARKRLHRDIKRQELLHDLDALTPKVYSILDGLQGWTAAVEAAAERRLRFKTMLPELFDDLRKVASRPDCLLTISERIRDHAAEADYQRRNRRPPQQPIFRYTEGNLAPLGGAPFFMHDQPDNLLKNAMTALYRTADAGRSTQAQSSLVLALAKKAIEEARDHVENIWTLQSAMITFFAKENLKNVVIWANAKEHRERYRAGDIAITDIGRATIHLAPGEIPLLDRAPLDALRAMR